MNKEIIEMAEVITKKELAVIVDGKLSKLKLNFSDAMRYATTLHKAGYRPEMEVKAETAKEIVKNILAFSYYIKFEDTDGTDREELVVYESKIKQLAAGYSKEE